MHSTYYSSENMNEAYPSEWTVLISNDSCKSGCLLFLSSLSPQLLAAPHPPPHTPPSRLRRNEVGDIKSVVLLGEKLGNVGGLFAG